jgi:hypothetical protein
MKWYKIFLFTPNLAFLFSNLKQINFLLFQENKRTNKYKQSVRI